MKPRAYLKRAEELERAAAANPGEAIDVTDRRQWESAIKTAGGLKVGKDDRGDFEEVPKYLKGYKHGIAPDELMQQVAEATGRRPRDVERAFFASFHRKRREKTEEEAFEEFAKFGAESRPRVKVYADTFELRPRSPFKGTVRHVNMAARHHGFRGAAFTFYGAFKTKAAARRREGQVPHSFIQPRSIRGHRRFVVMRENPLTRKETGELLKAARRAAQQSRRRHPSSMTATEVQAGRAAIHRAYWAGQAQAFLGAAHGIPGPRRKSAGMQYRLRGPSSINPRRRRKNPGGGGSWLALIGVALALFLLAKPSRPSSVPPEALAQVDAQGRVTEYVAFDESTGQPIGIWDAAGNPI